MQIEKMVMRIMGAVLFFFLLGGACSAQQVTRISIAELQAYIHKSEKPLVVNFWATFCKPCVEEIPYFQSTIRNQYKGDVELLLVSLDLPDYYPSRIANFATQKNFSASIFWLNETNADYFCPMIDSSWSGAIPCTLMINNKKRYRKFFDDQLSAVQFEKELKALVL